MEIKMAEVFGSEGMKNLHLRGALVLTGPEAGAAVLAVKNHDRLVEENKRLREAISSAISIKDLWLPSGSFTDCPPEHYGEIEALCMMARKFEQLLSELGGE
ncbi:hypothetical protein ACPFUU_001609 [Vibrio cholerae]